MPLNRCYRFSVAVQLCMLLCLSRLVMPVWASAAPSTDNGTVVRIGVLAHRGTERCLHDWTPTAEYLSERLPPRRFTIVPLGFDQVDPAVRSRQVHFIVCNPQFYAVLEHHGLAHRVVTRLSGVGSNTSPVFGGVVLTRADRTDLTTLQDLRSVRLAAVDPQSFGGWLAAARELHRAGIPLKAFTQHVSFLKTHDAVVREVLAGRFDAGIVRSTQLESMASDGVIDLADVRVIHPVTKFKSRHPYLLSTSLYPDWPLAAVTGAPDELCKQVAVALYTLSPGHPAAVASGGAGWTIPQDYSTVHQLLRELHLPPYDQPPQITLIQVWRAYWPLIIAILAVSCVMAAFLIYAHIANSRIRAAERKLHAANQQLAEQVQQLTQAMQEIKTLQGIVPICASCKRIRDDAGYWNQVEDYVRDHTDATFSHGICPQCAKELYAQFLKPDERLE